MHRRPGLLLCTLTLAFALLSRNSTEAYTRTYVEDFSTRQYLDYSSAWWDTTAGELKLHPFEITLAGAYDTPGSGYGVALSGPYAFIADGVNGLLVIDVSDPEHPSLAGVYNTPGTAYRLTIEGDYLYLADYASGLQVIDITDPTNPVPAGNYNTPGYARGVAVSGDYAYVADQSAGMQVVDVSDPTNPTLAASHHTPDDAYDVDVEGDLLFVADGLNGLRVFDISDPTFPLLIGNYNTPASARDVVVAGDVAYVADASEGIQVIDVSVPASPSLLANYNTAGTSNSLALSGDYAYVADGSSGITVIDVSDPEHPTLFDSFDVPGTAYDIALWGEYAYLAHGSAGLQVVDICDFAIPSHVGIFSYSSLPLRVALSGDFAYFAHYLGGLVVADMSDPTNPTLAGSYDTGTAYDVAVSGDRAYVADFDSGLVVVDVSDPTNPLRVARYATPGRGYAVTISGDFAYVCDFDSGLVVVDVSDPANPSLAGRYIPSGRPKEAVIAGDHAFLVHTYGLDVLDISDPTAPTLAGSYSITDTENGIAVSGNHAYFADGDNGLLVLDVSVPTNPVLVGSYDTPGEARSVSLAGYYAYVSDWDGGLQVIDVSNPANPTVAWTYPTPDQALQSVIFGDYALVVEYGDPRVYQIRQRRYDSDSNIAVSKKVNGTTEGIAAARLSVVAADSIRWELSVDGGTNWNEFLAGDGYRIFPSAGADLRWRSTHFCAGPDNPACTDLTIEWLVEAPFIESIVDVPFDQGKQVTVTWLRSAYDVPGTDLITHYSVWRSLSGAEAAARLASGAGETEGAPCRAQRVGSTTYVWEWLADLPAHYFDEYAYTATTLYDSTALSDGMHHFLVSAQTEDPFVFYDSDPDSGYSVDNLAPGAPLALQLAGPLTIAWRQNPEEDLDHYAIYAGADSALIPDPSSRIGETTDTTFVLPDTTAGLYVLVTALDFAGNESDPSNTIWNTTSVAGGGLPPDALFARNAPNPFNPRTTVHYGIPAGGEPSRVTITIYSSLGREIRTVVDTEQGPGRYTATWDGTDAGGAVVASGVYFCRVAWSGESVTNRMVLIR